MVISGRLKFLIEAGISHSKTFYAYQSERPVAQELETLGLLADVDDTDAGCFALTPKGMQMLELLDRTLNGTIRASSRKAVPDAVEPVRAPPPPPKEIVG